MFQRVIAAQTEERHKGCDVEVNRRLACNLILHREAEALESALEFFGVREVEVGAEPYASKEFVRKVRAFDVNCKTGDFARAVDGHLCLLGAGCKLRAVAELVVVIHVFRQEVVTEDEFDVCVARRCRRIGLFGIIFFTLAVAGVEDFLFKGDAAVDILVRNRGVDDDARRRVDCARLVGCLVRVRPGLERDDAVLSGLKVSQCLREVLAVTVHGPAEGDDHRRRAVDDAEIALARFRRGVHERAAVVGFHLDSNVFAEIAHELLVEADAYSRIGKLRRQCPDALDCSRDDGEILACIEVGLFPFRGLDFMGINLKLVSPGLQGRHFGCRFVGPLSGHGAAAVADFDGEVVDVILRRARAHVGPGVDGDDFLYFRHID